jgi:hypothetical protein
MSEMKLRLNPSRNNQEKKANWAEDYEFKASVAGLEPRRRLRVLYITSHTNKKTCAAFY